MEPPLAAVAIFCVHPMDGADQALMLLAAKTKMPQRPLPSLNPRWPDRLRLLCFSDRSTAASPKPESFSYLRKRLDIIFRNLQDWQGESQYPVAEAVCDRGNSQRQFKPNLILPLCSALRHTATTRWPRV